MKRILITGVNGLLGQAIINVFKRKYIILMTGQEEESYILKSEWEYRQLDITRSQDCKDTIQDFSPDVVINAASYTNVDACEKKKELCWNINVKGVENLANLCRRFDLHFIHYSTDYVFDGKNGPYSETDQPLPIGYYGKSKLASENVLNQIGCPSSIIRTCVLYGNGNRVKKNFFLWVLDNLRSNKKITVVTDQFNNPTLAEDLALGTKLTVDKSILGLFHMGGTAYINRYEFAVAIANVFTFPEALVIPITTNELKQLAPRPCKGGLKIEYAQTEIGYNPRSLAESLNYLKWDI